MEGLTRILLEVNAGDIDLLQVTFRRFDFEEAIDTNRGLPILADLIALWQVRVEVVLTVENRPAGNGAAERQGCPQDMLYGFLIKHWKRTREAQTNGTAARVWLAAKGILTPAEHLAVSQQLRMALHSNTDDV